MPKDEFKVRPPKPWYHNREMDANRNIKQPTEDQIQLLLKLRYPEEVIQEMTRREATAAISELLRQRPK